MRLRPYEGWSWLWLGRSWWLRRTYYQGSRIEFRLRQPDDSTPARISLGKWQLTWMRDCMSIRARRLTHRYRHYRRG